MPQGVIRGYMDMPWGQLHYRTVAGAPADAPLMVLLHQSPLSSRNYERLLPLLAGHCRPFAIDTPGYGASSPAPESWAVRDYAGIVWQMADTLGAASAIVFGRATGAVFALEAALLQPRRTRTLILHGMPVYTDAERADRMAHFAPPFALDADGSHLQGIWNRIKGEYPWIPPDMATRFTQDFLAAGADFAQSYRAIWRHDLPARVGTGLDTPCLLIGGSDDRIAFMHARATALLPRAEAVWLDGATDFVAEQDAPRLASHLLAFIGRTA